MESPVNGGRNSDGKPKNRLKSINKKGRVKTQLYAGTLDY